MLRPGDCVLYETTRPFQWLFRSDWDVWVFSLPSESVRLSDSERLPAEQSERVLAHVSDLVVTLLSDQLDDSTRVRGAVQRSLLLRIKDYIHQRLHDPALGPAEIAVSLYIKGLRLDRARRDLLDPRLVGRPISAIAYSCGFGDLSGFNRAFKEAYGVSPRELRNASATGG